MKGLLRKDIDSINAYIPGLPIELVQRKFKIKKVIKLASNENAFGAPAKAKNAIKKNLNDIFRYPDGSCYYLKNSLAKKLKIKPENILFGNGSDEIIDIIIKTFLNPDEEIITAQTTFVEYEIIAKANGSKAKTVPLKNFCYDLNAIKQNLTKKTKIIFIANPNNPTGTYVKHNELLGFIEEIGSNKLIVIDEAYLEFAEAKDFPKLIKHINEKNIIILRTFSKAYGLAGLRIGYAIAKEDFIKPMEKIRQPFNVNFLAQKAAEAALSDTAFINRIAKTIIKEKNKMYKEFEAIKIEYIPSQANFIMFKTNLDGIELCEKMLKEGIIIRDLKQYKLDNYVRVTIGRPNENKLFIQRLKKILNEITSNQNTITK